MSPGRVLVPAAATDDDLRLVHDADYVARFNDGRLDPLEERQIGFPWSPELVQRSRRAAGGTIAAARHALTHGVAMNLAGGTHHAFPDHGEGFCVYNDVAVAIRVLQRDGLIRRAAVVDLDVHQGNGTHAIFAGDESVYTFSMHGGRTIPFTRCPARSTSSFPTARATRSISRSSLAALPGVLAAATPDVVFYIAGADPHEGDTLGRLALTFDGLARRDAYVISQCREVGIPVAIAIGGGYGKRIEDTVAIHAETARIAGTFA